jgi:hypothetical protein
LPSVATCKARDGANLHEGASALPLRHPGAGLACLHWPTENERALSKSRAVDVRVMNNCAMSDAWRIDEFA